MWQTLLRWLSLGKNSATHAWSNIVILATALIGALPNAVGQLIATAGDLLGDPDLKTQVLALVPHDSVPLVVIGIMLITKLARNRPPAK